MSVAHADAVAKPSLTLKRRLNAPAEKVYAAWTDPRKIVKWFGPDAGPVTKAEIDLRVGGGFTIAFSTEDGEHHQVGGVYREVVPNERLQGLVLVPIQAFLPPPSRRTSAIASPPAVKRSVVSLGSPGTSRTHSGS